MLPEQSTDPSPVRQRRAQSRVAGLLASLWARRLAYGLGVPEHLRLDLEHAARHVTARNFRGDLRPSALALVNRYRHAGPDDLLVAIVRVAETFAIGSMQPRCDAKGTIVFMRDDAAFYRGFVVDALELCLGGTRTRPKGVSVATAKGAVAKHECARVLNLVPGGRIA